MLILLYCALKKEIIQGENTPWYKKKLFKGKILSGIDGEHPWTQQQNKFIYENCWTFYCGMC